MSQITPDSFDAVHPANNGESRNSSRALVVRDHESQMLSPYVMPGGMSPYGAEPAASGLNFTQLMHALRRRWLLALCTGLIVGLPLAAVVWLITPSNYEVIAWLKVGDASSRLMDKGGYVRRDPGEYDQYRKTQSALIKSPDVLRLALNDPAIANLPMIANESKQVDFLRDEISVAIPLESEVLQIKMRGKDRSQLVKIVNAVKDSYLKNIVEAERQGLNHTLNVLDKEVKQTRREIKEKRDQLQNLAVRIKSPDIASAKMGADLAADRSRRKLAEITEAKSELSKIQSQITVSEKRAESGNGPPEHMVEQILMRDPGIGQLSQKIAMYEEVLAMQRMAVLRPDRDPTVLRFSKMLNETRHQLEQAKAEMRPVVEKAVEAELNGVGGGANGRPTDMESMITMRDTLQDQIVKLEEEYQESTNEAINAMSTSADLESLGSEIKGLEELAHDLETKRKMLDLESQMPARVTELAPATEPEGANPLLRYFLTAFAAIVGIAVGAGGVVMLEYQARRVNSTTDMSMGVGLSVLGTVPNIAKLSNSKGLNGSAALQGILAESVDSIRTMLLTRENPPHSIILTSAGDSEGKTTVATHLAASLARSGRRTLLIDGDLRSPSIHGMFNAAPEPGVCEVLRGEADFEGVLQPTSVDGLMFVAAGQCDYQCIAALAKDHFKELLEKARAQFEFVVIDSAPVLTYSDMLLMGTHADAAILSVRRDVSQMNRVYEARERMESVGIHVLGAVVNGITEVSRRPAYALLNG